jgi:hypothetical protein
MSALPQKADILFGGESHYAPQHAELRQVLELARERPRSGIRMSALHWKAGVLGHLA